MLWAISRVCEAFHCVPDEAERLLLDDPRDTAIRVLEFRGYADAFRAYRQADGKLDQLDQSPMMDLVIDHDFALQKARLKARLSDG